MSDPMQTPPPHQPSYTQGPRRLVRSRNDRMIAGVCGGLAQYAGMDVTLVRVLTAVATFLGFGSLAVLYLVLWLVLPEE